MTEGCDIVDQAIGWHLRQAVLSSAEWHDFVAWLEADAAHAAAFDRVALDDALLGDLPRAAAPIVPVAPERFVPQRSRRWGWAVGGTAVAAGIAALVMPLVMVPGSAAYTVRTAPGEKRVVALADGTRIELNGATTLHLDRNDTRVATLDSGEAVFAVHHDDGKAFVLHSGNLAVQDVGTVFDVSRSGARLDVAVAEGAVSFQPGREAILVKAGNALVAHEDVGQVVLSKIAVDAVGGWRNGRLAFNATPLGDVAQAIRRVNGADLRFDPDLSAQTFTGMVQLTGDAAKDVPHIAALVGAGWRRDGERWVISPEHKAGN
ncbi:FecR domain-containing protein [Sphingomonas sp. RT2P30]|uniref:FecR family protein n=1 Tax=Parasphingomonas halimpatiens TaxID=3096162 RepID=UPI002FC5D168